MSEYPMSLPFREGLQPREPRFGVGESQRVWEYPYRGSLIGVNLGDIAAAPTEAIMCPTTPWLRLGGGAVERRIASVAGDKLFGTYNKKVIQLLTRMRSENTKEALEAAAQFSQFLTEETGMKIGKTPQEIRDDTLVATTMQDLEIVGEHVAICSGGSMPAPSGNLAEKGIRVVILTNVTPPGDRMTVEDMAQFTFSASIAANMTGADSLTVPAVGTGFAADAGVGLSLEESMAGFFKGATDYLDQSRDRNPLKRIDFNMYARPSGESASHVTEMLSSAGVLNFLAGKAQ
ncbi:MAG: hypothetical protein A2785_04315 [Candidatus Chisholmbacteria bacterium RIFCSPHIGHO2_01_FULL_49_18]|uniref:Macro domain-containing protein n=2 Tax=Candidatus Chisholmiibacteriota TaxID=1817900 RepID=A0A1G1VP86_9BACT|nr:MAG: hypothetical protein A2785_04315 [Candidatus Chisholmbacteria bacterium RIFCSPHIGHO2_01_FULL_49_18]OGY22549.1 MAG: hypothetical protein A3A65_00980 [Candidatus Chisholmbacteria bacterium RIFCSPLOWO2_01_FULL_49_14]